MNSENIDVSKDDLTKDELIKDDLIKNKCQLCNKKTGLIFFKCKYCNKNYCCNHRIPEYHDCLSNYKIIENHKNKEKLFLNQVKDLKCTKI